MERLAKEDVIKGLKAAKRLAKQDLLASSLTANPDFWIAQAEARRRRYGELIDLVEKEGVEAAYAEAVRLFLRLPEEIPPDAAELRGESQALKMFFTILGRDERQVLQEAQVNKVPAMEMSMAGSAI